MAQENPETTEALLKEAKIVSTRERHADVSLDWPVEFDGKTNATIRVRRVTGLEVETFLKEIGALKGDAPMLKPPMIDCPIEVYEALDDDDRLRVEEAMVAFLPRRLTEVAASVMQVATGQ
jgi:hypothetical protein